MNKKKKGRKFNRETDQRKAFLRSLVNNFFLKEKIRTTEARAKELTRIAERQITKAKNITLAKRRALAQDLSPKALEKLEKEIAPMYKERKGGYTRIIKIGPRSSDGAKMVVVELVK